MVSHAYSTSTAIFILILLLNITLEHTLHSRVNSNFKEDLYINANFASTLLWKSSYYLVYELC